jgi:hypothetical protein
MSPEVCVLSWLVFLGVAVWRHVRVTEQPPIFDSLTYYWKAYSFWQAIHLGNIVDPLNLQPTFRPPGTIAMSYPFGFDPDPRGFYFRSVFLPAVLLTFAVLVAASRRRQELTERWYVALTAIFFSTPSLLYWFAIIPGASTTSYWGLVDGFLAGIAALAAAAAWKSVKQNSCTWTLAVALLSSFCIVIKPSGTFLAALIGVLWVFLTFVRIITTKVATRARTFKSWMRVILGALTIAIMDVTVLAASVNSQYLSEPNIAYGQKMIVVARAELKVPLLSLWRLGLEGLGAPLMLWMSLAIVIVISGCFAARRQRYELDESVLYCAAALAAVFAALFGGWFWLFFSGGQAVIRYAVPFFMVAMVLMVPPVVGFRMAARSLTIASIFIMLGGSVNLAMLLARSSPGLVWQRWSGVSISPGLPFPPMTEFKRFVEQPRAKRTFVYSLDIDEADEILDSLSGTRWIFHPELAPISIRRPVKWDGPTTYHIDELLSSDYLLFRPVAQPSWQEVRAAGTFVPSFERECLIFRTWASSLTSADGVDVVVDFPSAKILAIRDRAQFRRSLMRVLPGHRWRPVFTEANRGILSEASAGL